MNIESLASWLRCPACLRPLEPIDALTLGCDTGHRYDVNKRGFVNLVSGGTKLIGDSAAMLDARDRVLESGLYSPITDAVRSATAEIGGTSILDAGAGTGHYLRAALESSADARGLAMDLSAQAVSRAVRSSPRIDGLVADTWRPLPVRDAVCEVILDVFAPRNLPEFHRALAPGGSLLVVVPLPEHLAELQGDAGMLAVPADKSAEIADAARPLFELRSRRAIHATIALTQAVAESLVGMGPSAHHTRSHGVTLPSEATLAVELLHFARA